MEYYGASEADRRIVSSLLGLKFADMGQDWEFVLSDTNLIPIAIDILLREKESREVRAAIACITISSLYDYYRDMGVDHPLRDCAVSAIRKDHSIFSAMKGFWSNGGGGKYVLDLLGV
ncbi:hypothetical protein ACFPTX_08350 [Pseudomonas sp. GCM10022188]|uniref:hypothetical protein n=1 Tax=Pseudomonas TaxID=286 RepID=UPI001E4269C0|nr:hypothetical protein [Pseudomonas oryzagri]MCC6074541.1 hypothetical protein [Pseudomonas oryzagri]